MPVTILLNLSPDLIKDKYVPYEYEEYSPISQINNSLSMRFNLPLLLYRVSPDLKLLNPRRFLSSILTTMSKVDNYQIIGFKVSRQIINYKDKIIENYKNFGNNIQLAIANDNFAEFVRLYRELYGDLFNIATFGNVITQKRYFMAEYLLQLENFQYLDFNVDIMKDALILLCYDKNFEYGYKLAIKLANMININPEEKFDTINGENDYYTVSIAILSAYAGWWDIYHWTGTWVAIDDQNIPIANQELMHRIFDNLEEINILRGRNPYEEEYGEEQDYYEDERQEYGEEQVQELTRQNYNPEIPVFNPDIVVYNPYIINNLETPYLPANIAETLGRSYINPIEYVDIERPFYDKDLYPNCYTRMSYVRQDLMIIAFRRGILELVEYLGSVDDNLKITNLGPEIVKTLLEQAIIGNQAQMIQMLLDVGVKLNITNVYDIVLWKLLDYDTAKILLANGVNLSSKIYWYAKEGLKDIVCLLLAYGANIQDLEEYEEEYIEYCKQPRVQSLQQKILQMIARNKVPGLESLPRSIILDPQIQVENEREFEENKLKFGNIAI